MVPTFAVIGAARAGTTGLIEGLRGHPRAFVTTPKEPHYFAMHGTRPDYRGPGDEQSINQTAVTNVQDYQALFPHESGHLALGEGSVSTLYYHERALPELVRMNPDVRVVVLLREPVARAYSSFQYLRAQGREPEQDFRAALAKEPDRRVANWHHLWHYSAMSRYADALTALQGRLPAAQLGIWFHDELEQDYAGTLRQVIDFLDLPPVAGLGEAVPRVNISGVPRAPHVQRALSWASGRPGLRRTAQLVTTWHFREAVRSRMIRRDPVPAEVRSAVGPLFADDLMRLRRLLPAGRALPEWLSDERLSTKDRARAR